MTTIYGISNCDTVRKAKRWLDDHGIDYRFHDFRKDGITREMVDTWCEAAGLETVLNKRGTTWRQLPDEIKNNADDEQLKALLCEQPTLIKRPVLEHNAAIHIGFKADVYNTLFDV